MQIAKETVTKSVIIIEVIMTVENLEYKSDEERDAAKAFNSQSDEDIAEQPSTAVPTESNQVATEVENDNATQASIQRDGTGTLKPVVPIETVPTARPDVKETKKQPDRDYKIFSLEDRRFLRDQADKLIDHIKDKEYDSLIFLDSGARLVGYLIRERWKKDCPDIPSPPISFIKIGQEMGFPTGFGEMPNDYYRPTNLFERDYDDRLPDLHTIIFRYKENKRFNKLVRSIPAALTKKHTPELQGKKIMIVDDFMNSGQTLGYSKELFNQAYPNLVVDNWTFTSNHDKMPRSLGNQYKGLALPSYPASQGRDSLTLEPRRLSDYQAEIDKLEQQIPLLEEWDRKHEKKILESDMMWKSTGPRDRLAEIRSSQESAAERIKKYIQALREIHWLAKE